MLRELQVHQIELEVQNEELQGARDALEITSQRYADLYDLAPMPYVTLAHDGTIRHANHAAAALLGSNRASIVGSPLGLFFTGEFKPVFNDLLETTLKTGNQQTGELALLVNGQMRWVMVQAIAEPLRTSCLFTLQDITASTLRQVGQVGASLKFLVISSIKAVVFSYFPSEGHFSRSSLALNL